MAALLFLVPCLSLKLCLKALKQFLYILPDLSIGLPVQVEERQFILVKQEKLLLGGNQEIQGQVRPDDFLPYEPGWAANVAVPEFDFSAGPGVDFKNVVALRAAVPFNVLIPIPQPVIPKDVLVKISNSSN